MSKEKLENFKKNSKRCIAVVLLLFLLDTGSKIGKGFLKTIKSVEEFVEEYDESLDRVIANYPIIDPVELRKAEMRIIDNYLITKPGELDKSFERIIDNYSIVETVDKNQYIHSYLKQAINNINGNLNYGASLKKVINSYFNQETDFALDYYSALQAFIFEEIPLDGISYQELDNETKSECLATLSQLALILQERQEKKVF